MARHNHIQNLAIALLCALAILLAPWFGNCCCATAAAGPACQCAAPAGKSCCASKKGQGAAACQSSNTCDSSCECSAGTTDDAVVIDKRTEVETHSFDFSAINSVASNATTEIIRLEGRDPPSLSHARRQAELCVWRN